MNAVNGLGTTAAKIRSAIIIAAVVVLLLPATPTILWAAQDYRQVDGPCGLTFPADHGPHPGYRTEWWYYTGNLNSSGEHRFGFQLTFFRHQIAPSAERREWPAPASPWRTDTIYLAHAAVTDISGGRHLQAEKIARPVLSMAGAAQNGSTWTVHLDTWKTSIAEDRHALEADTDAFSLSLDLVPAKPIVLHGAEGYSRKGGAPERASCYYSYTRMKVRGTVSIGDHRHNVTGAAWMDHEFSTAPLEPGLVGWDWFSLQLSDKTEIMIFLLRQKDGHLNPATSGTYVLATGETRRLSADDIRIKPLDHWTSPHSGARYPVQWNIAIPVLDLEVKTSATVAGQEMRTPQSTNVSYWEGSIAVSGIKAGRPVTGWGYIEMTGYAHPFDTDL